MWKGAWIEGIEAIQGYLLWNVGFIAEMYEMLDFFISILNFSNFGGDERKRHLWKWKEYLID